MPKLLSLPGLYIIDEIKMEISNLTRQPVLVFKTVDSVKRTKKEVRLDAVCVAENPQEAKKVVEYFFQCGQISRQAKMSYYPVPPGYRQSLIIVSLDKALYQPCLVRHPHLGRIVSLLFYPHQVRF